jgi:TonB-dependent SusC/RagA subfamily outer membrane receptor
MMINGWRRFVWNEILAGQFPILLYAPSLGLKPDEVFVTAIKPFSPVISEKVFATLLNEQYDQKIIKKNTRESLRSKAKPTERNPNVLVMDQNSSSYSDMVEYLKGKVAGVTVMNDGIRIRGTNSINSGLDPLILQDGIEIGFSTLKTVAPREVSSVEVLKGPDASLYGVRGANGVIIIHLRRGGDFMNEATIASEPSYERMVSYHRTREFYVPAYDSWDKKPSEFNVPRAVYWNPNITIDSTGTSVIRVKNPVGISNIKASIEGLASDGSVLFYQSVK